MLDKLAYFLSSADFFKLTFQKFLSGILSVSNSVDPDLAQCFARPDMDSNCLQRFSADESSLKQGTT